MKKLIIVLALLCVSAFLVQGQNHQKRYDERSAQVYVPAETAFECADSLASILRLDFEEKKWLKRGEFSNQMGGVTTVYEKTITNLVGPDCIYKFDIYVGEGKIAALVIDSWFLEDIRTENFD